MSARGRVMCLLPGVPWPANTGGALRTLNVLRALDRAFELSVLAWRREGEDRASLALLLAGEVEVVPQAGPARALVRDASGIASGLPGGYGRYSWPAAVLRERLSARQFDAVHFDHPHTALCWRAVRRLQPRAALVLDAHNVEADVVEQLAGLAPTWGRRALLWQARRIRALEREIARHMDLVIACSDADARAFAAMGARRVAVVPNSAPPQVPAAVAQRRDLIFVGSLDWRPNAAAALELAKKIWPRCRALLPGARLVLVGRNPPRAIRALARSDVIVAATVDSVQPFLDGAFATAIPVRAGSGTRIKILEAWAAGVPVIASRRASDGLPCRDGADLLFAEDADEFADAVIRLWRDRSLAQRLIAEARRTAAAFSAERSAHALVEHYCEELRLGA